jgi:hypothetical protein
MLMHMMMIPFQLHALVDDIDDEEKVMMIY